MIVGYGPTAMKFLKYLMKLVKKGVISEKRANTIFEAGRKSIKGYYGLKNLPQKVKAFPGEFANRPAGLLKVEKKARKQVEKELLNDKAYAKWLKPSTDNLKERLRLQQKNIDRWKSDRITVDERTGELIKGRNSVGALNRLKDLEGDKINTLKKLKDLMSKRTRENYNAAVKLQLRNTPITWRNRPIKTESSTTGLARGMYRFGRSVDEQNFGRAMKGLDIRKDPSNPYAGIYKKLIRTHRKGDKSIRDIYVKGLKKEGALRDVVGDIHMMKKPFDRKGQYRTLVHELKHSAQAPLSGYTHGDAMYKHIPWDPYMKQLSDRMKYLTDPAEISARLSELRTLSPLKRISLAKGWSKGKNVSAYQDLLKVFKTPANINKALRDNWGMAPLGGLLGGGAIGGEE